MKKNRIIFESSPPAIDSGAMKMALKTNILVHMDPS